MKRIKIIPLAILSVTIFLVYRIFLGSNGMINQYFITSRNSDMRERIDSLGKLIILKDDEIERLESDTAYIEFIARTQLGMSMKGEKIIKFVSPDSSNHKSSE
ncbi:MAG: septum formation initiator family protein [Fibrobacterales bacterium]